MEARAFGAYEKRTQTKTYKETPAGYVFAIVPWVITVAYLAFLIATKNLGFLQT